MYAARLLLLPFSWLYGAVLLCRHTLYDLGVLQSVRPSIPTIVIGNLTLGGTGKTPMLELVLRILGPTPAMATLSRGYGRKGSALHEVAVTDRWDDTGDEPLQVKVKHPQVHVFVGADRVTSIKTIVARLPEVKVTLLDDALQHRKLNASLNIVLTTFRRPWYKDHLVPAGGLRDLRSRRKAAQVVVVTKCPALPDVQEQRRWRERLGLAANQELFFTGIAYAAPYLLNSAGTVDPAELPTMSCLLFTGIADPDPLVQHVRKQFGRVEHVAFGDHHAFSSADLEHLAKRYATFAPGPKMLITTEKDAMRSRSVIAGSPLEKLPIGVIGMRAVVLNEPERFSALIRDHVATYPAHS